ncbi:uncharacterized protein K460DRAFT_437402 [Cucurbitaria berberidis CBS 394.84]|uniref:Uncharacterized protein n=1 Tax=Cucurbitaria berberidis CBS 394.84 TaxID=1168544 RepID=A0A9P4L303_9PLEO|nr:uncharacterized protein K460DRAFT_437402 [Cucurbitaria berberidis CBS 394.84]KAF1840336.1 hypothetical protein K460DRAFT_437402 [Cucurbitaria berberidis CBS 394.84]
MSTNPSTPSANGSCYFFRLPGELRNRVYQFSLSEPEGLRYHQNSDSVGFYRRTETSKNDSHDSEANQLKYVCRRLNQETRGLGIRYNMLYFDNFMHASWFLDGYPEKCHGYLSLIDIAEGNVNGSWIDADAKIVKLCVDQPHVMVRERTRLLRSNDRYLVRKVICAQYGLRASTELARRIIADEYVRGSILRDCNELFKVSMVAEIKSRVPQNYRMFPAEESFDEQAFRKMIKDNSFLFERLIPKLNGGLECLIAVLKELFERGI